MNTKGKNDSNRTLFKSPGCSDDFCTCHILVKCPSHPSNVHPIYIWGHDFGHVGFVTDAKINPMWVANTSYLQSLGPFKFAQNTILSDNELCPICEHHRESSCKFSRVFLHCNGLYACFILLQKFNMQVKQSCYSEHIIGGVVVLRRKHVEPLWGSSKSPWKASTAHLESRIGEFLSK